MQIYAEANDVPRICSKNMWNYGFSMMLLVDVGDGDFLTKAHSLICGHFMEIQGVVVCRVTCACKAFEMGSIVYPREFRDGEPRIEDSVRC
jgi:hypothetical protein